MLPVVINETMVYLFKYWNEGMCEGMRHDNKLYSCYKVYPAQKRLQAYTTACELSEQGFRVCLTVSAQDYRVWMDLRSPRLSNVVSLHQPLDRQTLLPDAC